MNQLAVRRGARLVLFAAIAVLGVVFLWNFERFRIPPQDQSLAPAHPGGSRGLCRNIDADDALERDTDVIYAMKRDGVQYERFGRVRGLPGDEIGADEKGRMTVNGKTIGPIALRGEAMGRVPDGKVLILAVNPQETNYPDSRRLGFIDRRDVHAVIFAAWGVGR